MARRLARVVERPVKKSPSVAILGGGLAGMAAAFTLARAGWRDVTLIESGPELGGLAATYRHGEAFYPLAYHHILHRDRALLWMLEQLGALPQVRWRKIRMLFRVGGRLYDLAHPVDFARFPMGALDKLRFARLMLRCFGKSDWDDWNERSAAELVDGWGGAGVRAALFESLCRLKFDRPAEEVSGAWLGARLHYREGSAPLGYIPGTNWTKTLCEGLARSLMEQGVELRLGRRVVALRAEGSRIQEVVLDDGSSLAPEMVVSTLPTEVYRSLAPDDESRGLAEIRYTAVVSALCVTRQTIEPDFYWMNLASLKRSASGLFRLESLNPSIGAAGESCLNFVTHVPSKDHPYFGQSDDELMNGFREDFQSIFGFRLEAEWTRLHRLSMYSPIFLRGYRNPPVCSESFGNVYFAGNYRTFPSIASTGTAMAAGFSAGAAMLESRGGSSDVESGVDAFRLAAMPRAR